MVGIRPVVACLAAAALTVIGSTGAAAIPDPGDPPPPPTDLVLLLDGSGSIDAGDWTLQLQGYAAAIRDEVNFPLDGSVAVSVIQWSSNGWNESTRVEVPLTVLEDDADVEAVAQKVLGIAQIGASTNPGDALRAGTDELLARGRAGAEGLLCMSTDGEYNSGEWIGSARDYAVAQGVDKYSVVAIEDPPYFDEVAANTAYGPYVFGGGTVTVARTTTEFTSLISGCVTDALQVRALEVSQVVQDWDNSVPLLFGKPTLVRAFVETPDASQTRVVGRLRGVRDGVELPESPLTPINGDAGVVVDGLALDDRGDLDSTLNFSLPGSWTLEGDLELSLELPGGSVCIDETYTQVPCGERVHFQRGWSADITYRSLTWDGLDENDELDYDDLGEQHRRAVDQLPTAGWSAGFSTLDVGDRPDPDSLEDVNEQLNAARSISDPSNENRWYGVLPGSSGGKAGGLASGRVASGWDGDLTGETAEGYARNRVVHELGHTYGLHHSVNADQNGYDEFLWWDTAKRGWCDEKASTDAPEYPDWVDAPEGRRPALGPVGGSQSEIWGLATRMVGVDEGLALSAPQSVWSLMGYCTPSDNQWRWIGQHDYRQLLDGDRAPISGGEADTAPGSGLMLRGRVRADGQAVALRPALAVDLAPTATDAAGTHVLQVLDAAGGVLHETRFSPTTSDEDVAEGASSTAASDGVFAVVVPREVPGAASVVVRHGGEELAREVLSDHAPAVSVSAPTTGSASRVDITWSSSDADGPQPRDTVLYSADDGASWQVVGIDLARQSLSVARWALPGSQHARVRVISSDGARSTVATSEAFTMPNLAPTVQVTSPADGTVATGSQTVVFSGSAQDAEDGTLAGDSLVWSSDLDGPLGTGGQVTRRADTLSAGRHVVTLRATDSSGAAGLATFVLTVQRIGTPPPPSVDVVFGGFESPVSADTENEVNAGRTIPVKWTVTGSEVDDSSVVSAAFDSDGATYALERSGGTWHMNVQTPKEWAGTLRLFTVVLADGSVHEASFRFR